MEENPRKRRRFQYSLWTLLIGMTIVAVALAVTVPLADYVSRVRQEAQRKEMDRLWQKLKETPNTP